VIDVNAIVDPRVRTVTRFVREHLSDPHRLSLVDAARLTNVSPEHFCRIFRARTGVSFADWQGAYRMEHAKGLILDRWMPIGIAGMAVGYDHASTFVRVFKRYEGVKPKELRPFANTYPDLVGALRSCNARLVFRVAPLAGRDSPAVAMLERLAQWLRGYTVHSARRHDE
jgi:AraC-like DNA-binding protein